MKSKGFEFWQMELFTQWNMSKNRMLIAVNPPSKSTIKQKKEVKNESKRTY